MRFSLLLLLFVMCGTLVKAQYNPTIRSARARAMTGTFTVGKNVFQIHSGVQFVRSAPSNERMNRYQHATTLRYGIIEDLELTGLVKWQLDYKAKPHDLKKGGISGTQLGLRYNFLDGKEGRPALGLQSRVILPFNTKDFNSKSIGLNMILASGKKVNDWLSLVGNLGFTWAGKNQIVQSKYVASSLISISPKWLYFVEIYGGVNEPTVNYNVGASYRINDNLLFDLSGAISGKNNKLSGTFDIGFSWRTTPQYANSNVRITPLF